MNSPAIRNPGLISQLREQLAEVVRQLDNPRLYQMARTQLEARAERLRFEIDALEHPTPFVECGHYVRPAPHLGWYSSGVEVEA